MIYSNLNYEIGPDINLSDIQNTYYDFTWDPGQISLSERLNDNENLLNYKDKTFNFLQTTKIDNFTVNKTISKARESYRISNELKQELFIICENIIEIFHNLFFTRFIIY